MASRKVPRPTTRANSPSELNPWIRHLCLDSASHGLAASTVAECHAFLDLAVLHMLAIEPSPHARADALRQLLGEIYKPIETNGIEFNRSVRAKLHLLGLSRAGFEQPVPRRRKLAADSLVRSLDNFRRFEEDRLLLDVAHDLWRAEMITCALAEPVDSMTLAAACRREPVKFDEQ